MASSAVSHLSNPHDAEKRLRMLIDAAPVAMLVVEQGGKIVLANRQTEKTFGYEVEELLGQDVGILVPEPVRKSHRGLVADYFKAGASRVMGVGREIQGVDRNGRTFPVEIGLTPFDSGDGPQVIAAIIDISERKRIETESTLARIVQQAMLPAAHAEFEGYDIAGTSEPADATGGDFFDYIPLADHRLGLVIGDASGHGFAAALVTVAARSYLRALSRHEKNVSQIMAAANELLIEDVRDGRFVTLFCAVLDPTQSVLTYAGAGHSGYLLGRDGKLKEVLESTGPPFGWFPHAEYPSATLRPECGDILLLLTDGIEEAFAQTGELFGRNRVIDAVMQHSHERASKIVRGVQHAVARFRRGRDQNDDATLIVVKFD